MLRSALVLGAMFVGSVGCSGGNGSSIATHWGSTAAAPPQSSHLLAAVRLTPGNPPTIDLVTLAPDGDNVEILVSAPREEAPRVQRIDSPAWAPDAAAVYFAGTTAEREGDRFTYPETDIFRASLKGEVRRVTALGDALAPVPAPDGETILFGRMEHPAQRPFTMSLWLARADGTDVRRLLEAEEGRLDFPGSWSSDGSTIAFARCSSIEPDEHGRIRNTCGVFTVSPDGSGVEELAGRARQPVFSPEGRRIAFVSDRDENGVIRTGEDEDAYANELYVMDADGGHRERLTSTASLDEGSPAWSPDSDRIAYQVQGETHFGKDLRLTDPSGSCEVRIVGDAEAAGNTREPWYEQPAWRPGRVMNAPAALECS